MRDHALDQAAETAARPRLAVIFNPVAGGRRRFAPGLARLTAGGVQARVLATRARGDAERFAAELAAAGGVDAIVAAGGDGTINEVINGMAGSALPLGILPLGTANVLAWELGIGSVAAAADAILGGARRHIHLGRCNGRHFVMMVGVGVDAHVVASMRPWLKRALGKGAYALEGLHQIVRLKPVRYRVAFDGIEADAGAVIVANGRYYAGRYVVAPKADLGAPALEACLFARSGRLQALRYSLAMVTHRLASLADIAKHPVTRLTIDGPAGEPVQGDGDLIARLPVEIELAAARLDMFVPIPRG